MACNLLDLFHAGSRSHCDGGRKFMNTDRFLRPIPILSMAAVLGWFAVIMTLGGTALAAPAVAPGVVKLEFKDTKGTDDPSDDTLLTMTTGYYPYRVTTDAGGNLYATDPEVNAIYKYNTNGHLVGAYRIALPRAVAVKDNGDILASGVLNGTNAIFVLQQSGVAKGVIGQNGNIVSDIRIDTTGNIYVTDIGGAVVSVLDKKDGVVSNSFGPYEDRHSETEVIAGASFTRTRHKLTSASGIAIGAADLYVVYREYVDYLTNSPGSTGCYVSGQANFTVDTTAYLNYPNTDGTYQYWCSAGARSIIADIDKETGLVKSRIQVDGYVSGATMSTGNELNPQGIALDNNGRLYVATAVGIKVYDAVSGDNLIPTGAFDSRPFLGLTFDAVNGRVLGATGNMVLAYGIDGGSNPANTAPLAPGLVSPPNKTYVSSKTPVLKVSNATDKEADPLTYGYELKDLNGTLISNGSGLPQGENGETTLTVTSDLKENTKYLWHVQAFDGNAYGAWSADAELCVNEVNDPPTTPVAAFPKGSDAAAPFSPLSWGASSDPDCYDFISNYIVEVSSDPAFSSVQSVKVGGTLLSIKLSNLAKGLTNGALYYWRVKAVDNNGGESAYGSGSFVYKTTVVRFESDQSGAKVYIDGNYGYNGRLLNGQYDDSGALKATVSLPLEIQDLNPGSHFVAFVKAGYETYHTIIYVKDPLIEDSVMTVAASSDKWVKASRIKPSAAGVELFKFNGGNATPFVVDYNNDGLKDIIAGGKVNVYNDSGELIDVTDGRVYLFLAQLQAQADGTTQVVLKPQGAISAGGAEINVGSRAVPFVVDYNNDGKKDLLVGSGDGNIYIYLNEGEDIFVSAGRLKDVDGLDIKVASNAAPTIIDYNNDGRKDLVVGSSDGTLRLYINKGSDDSPKFDAVYSLINANGDTLTAGSDSSAFFTDWNNDGKKDLVVGGGTMRIYLNIGSDDAPEFLSLNSLQGWIKEKKRERGNREFIPYLGYNEDIAITGFDLVPFIVDWTGASGRDLIVGSGDGAVAEY